MTEYLTGDQPGMFPRSFIPDWVILHPEIDEGALAVAAIIAAYRNAKTGEAATLKRATLYERFARKRAWLDRRTALLEHIGYLTRVPTYIDNLTKRRTVNRFDAHGHKNNQTSNSWMVNDTPPDGDEHPHPIRSSENSHPHKIDDRINHRNQVRGVIHTPGSIQIPHGDQGKQGKNPSAPPGGAPHRARGGLHTEPGGGSTQSPSKQHPHKQSPVETHPPHARTREAVDDVLDDVGGVGDSSVNGGGISDLAGQVADAMALDNAYSADADTDAAELDSARRLLRALRAQDGGHLSPRAVREFTPVIVHLRRDGHTSNAITEHITSGIRSGGGLRHRLTQLRDGHTSINTGNPASISPLPPLCGSCDNRFIEQERGDGDVVIVRCPNCHPARIAA